VLRNRENINPVDKQDVMPADYDSKSDHLLNSDGPDTMDRRYQRRLLCSDLITVRWSTGRGFAQQEVAVLEDYSETGAGLFLIRKIDAGVPILLQTQWESFGAWVRHCEWRENGYLLGVEFDNPRPEDTAFVPDHLVDLTELGL
jgi:hypothetical protein